MHRHACGPEFSRQVRVIFRPVHGSTLDQRAKLFPLGSELAENDGFLLLAAHQQGGDQAGECFTPTGIGGIGDSEVVQRRAGIAPRQRQTSAHSGQGWRVGRASFQQTLGSFVLLTIEGDPSRAAANASGSSAASPDRADSASSKSPIRQSFSASASRDHRSPGSAATHFASIEDAATGSQDSFRNMHHWNASWNVKSFKDVWARNSA